MTPPQEQAMTDTEQPSQWAVELAIYARNHAYDEECPAAALTIQRAFAEREAELVGALRLARNRLQMCAVDAVASGNLRAYEWSEWADQTSAALKSREAGHANPS